jgi:valyl-tRNA synthetase
MTNMPKNYDFTTTEQRLYQWWEENGWFKPEIAADDAEAFTIAIPPPNVTGALHQGHVLFVALEDLMIRRARMQGKAALWIPGTDHAGIATQLQVEKKLLRELEMTRQEIGREKFLEHTWAWKEEYGGRITAQLRRLGASCDWDRERFTMDEGLSRAVREAFVRLYRMGLIYQDEYLVNWSPGLQTAVSDLEVEYSEEAGFMYHFKYPLKDGGHLPVATTRPETILGDTALAVHPDDARYADYIGKTALVPMLNREIPIIADAYVDMNFGTGALKVTPGHDPNDFEIGNRHNLAIINVMNKDATMNENAGIYAGLDRFECRQKLWADMEEAGLRIAKKDHTLNVPRSQRGGEIIEPMVSRQWFADAKPMADMGLAAVRQGRIKIVPERFNKTWEYWLTNIRPWCISRQLWWGHRIPVWYVDGDYSQAICARDAAEALTLAQKQYGTDITLARLEQDPDVLDTWFSSGLWPFSTLGWPDDTPDLRRFYPTSVLETGTDILFFWVARMVMQGLMYTNDIPFHTIYLHGLVRDEKGRKMSKTTGNVIDPILVMDEYGTDALRFTLLTTGSPGNDLSLSMDRVANNRNFANKMWNMARFVTRNIENVSASDKPNKPDYTTADKWILTRLAETTATANRLMDNYLFGEAGRQVYDFLWGDFADWYLEQAKVQLAKGGGFAWTTLATACHVLEQGLRLLHPYIPYVTEETWQQLRAAFVSADIGIAPAEGWAEALIIAKYPETGDSYPDDVADFERIRELVGAIRAERAGNKVEPGRKIAGIIQANEHSQLLTENADVLAFLARFDESKLEIAETVTAPDQALTIAQGAITCYLPLAGMVDIAQEKDRLTNELANLDKQIAHVTKLLASPFAKKAPAHVVAKEQEKLADLQASHAQVSARLASIS